VIKALLLAVSEEQLRSNLRGDLPLVILGSIIAAIGVAAVVVHLSRRQSGERSLALVRVIRRPIWSTIAYEHNPIPDGLREPQGVWPFVNKLVEFATTVPALLLFENFYGKGWRSSVRWLIWAYVVFATIAFTSIVIQRRPDLVPTAGIGTVFLLPAILLLGRLMGYKRPQVQDQGVCLWDWLLSF
jgi:sigma-B regulation protein RsbU (phosphoserine phosphatase)